jgi:hypothetical protein
MSVIFFEGFTNATISASVPNNGLDPAYLIPTGISTANNSAIPPFVAFTRNSSSRLKLTNIGTHANKKLYFGLRVNYYETTPALPLKILEVYNDLDAPVLSIEPVHEYNSAVAAAKPNVLLDVKDANDVVLGTFVVSTIIADTGFSKNDADSSSGYGFFNNTLKVLEFEFDLVANTVAMRYEGQPLVTTTNAANVSLPAGGFAIGGFATYPTSAGVNYVGSQTHIYDLYLVDNQGTFANSWLGKEFSIQRVSLLGNPLLSDGWVDQTNATSFNVSAINSFDGDATYARTGTYPNNLLFSAATATPPQATPIIAGIRVQSDARKSTDNSKYVHIFQSPDTAEIYEIGSPRLLTNINYAKYTQFINENPERVGDAWSVDDINNGGSFGVRSLDPDA